MNGLRQIDMKKLLNKIWIYIVEYDMYSFIVIDYVIQKLFTERNEEEILHKITNRKYVKFFTNLY